MKPNCKNVCVVGAGRWGKNHIRTFSEMGCLAGVVESRPDVQKEIRAQYPDIPVFPNLGEVPFDDFDGFTVATPAETHFRIASEILRRKKHVLVEKPITLKAEDARRLKKLASDNGVNLMVGHVLLFHPAIRRIKELVESGKVGKLQYLYSNRLNLGTVRTEENILWSFAPHDLSIFQYLIGSMPIGVVSRGGAFLQPHIHDATMTILTYPENIVGHIFVSWLHPFKEQRLVVMGSKGMLSFEDSSEEKALFFYEKGIDWVKGEPIKRDGPTEVIPYDKKMALTEELRYFTEHLDGTPVQIADGRNAVEVLEILEKATQELLKKETSGCPETSTPAQTDHYVHPTACVDENVQIGKGTKIWHFSHVQSGCVIGEGCSLGQNVNVGNNVRIGNKVKIQNNVSVYEGVELEDFVFCGPSMVFTNIKQPRSEFPQRGSEFYFPTRVRKSASLGANSTVVCGTTIGQYAFVGAGAVVTKDVPDFALVVGNPARPIAWVCKCGHKLEFG
ncbi:MAG TPA: oxidoreductase, partial [bacterium]|nr:oxidoreductase [bacterium]